MRFYLFYMCVKKNVKKCVSNIGNIGYIKV